MDKEFEKIAQDDSKEPVEKKKPVAKKKADGEDKNTGSVKNTIELEPTLNEAKSGTVVLGWGRMNPVTVGHEKLANKIKSVAKSVGGTPLLYLTHSQDAKKNPLSYDDKVMLARKAFGPMVQKSAAKTIINAMQELDKRFEKVVLVVGQDRIKEFETLLNKYNGKDYNFDSIEIVSAGDRDPDAEGVEGMSASKMRAVAAAGDVKSFATGLPVKLKRDAQNIFDMVRAGMKLAEELEQFETLDEAVLTPQQRRQKAIIFRKYANKIKAAKKRMAKRAPTQDRVKKIAQLRARDIVRKKVAGKKDLNYNELDNAQKAIIDKKVQAKKSMIARLVKKLIPTIKKELYAKMSQKSTQKEELDLEFETMLEEQSGAPTKRFHEARKKDGSIKLDKRFRAFRNAAKPVEEGKNLDAAMDEVKKEREALKREHERELRAAKIADAQIKEDYDLENDADLLALVNQIWEEVELAESKVDSALANKADESGIPLATLKAVYKRGVGAWDQSPKKTTPQQWAMARVNSYIEKGGAYKADSDLREDKGTPAHHLGIGSNFKHMLKHAVKHVDYDMDGDVDQDDFKKLVPDEITGAEKKDLTKAAFKKYADEKKHTRKGVAFEEVELDSFFDLNEAFELTEASIIDKALAAIHKHVLGGAELGDIAFEVSRARGVNMSGRELAKAYTAKYGEKKLASFKDLDSRIGAAKRRVGMTTEEHGAGDEGTDELVKKYKKDTPGQDINEAFEELDEQTCDIVSMKQMKEFEKFVDRMFEKFGIDFNFTKHFGERMSDDRNKPCIKMKELADFITKIYKNQGKSLKGVAGAEAVIKDLQTDLNIPVAVKYDSNNDEFDVVMKTIMRKKNFKTPNKVIKY